MNEGAEFPGTEFVGERPAGYDEDGGYAGGPECEAEDFAPAEAGSASED